MRWVIVGDDFRFGARRAGDIALLARAPPPAASSVEQLDARTVSQEQRISSSAVRAALAAGDLAQAARAARAARTTSAATWCTAPSSGRQIGFPTLNLRLAHPRPGRARHLRRARARRSARRSPASPASACGPTVDDSGRVLLEVHLFDFAGEGYGKLVRVRIPAETARRGELRLARGAHRRDPRRRRSARRDAVAARRRRRPMTG